MNRHLFDQLSRVDQQTLLDLARRGERGWRQRFTPEQVSALDVLCMSGVVAENTGAMKVGILEDDGSTIMWLDGDALFPFVVVWRRNGQSGVLSTHRNREAAELAARAWMTRCMNDASWDEASYAIYKDFDYDTPVAVGNSSEGRMHL